MLKSFNSNNNITVEIVPHTFLSFYHSPGAVFTLLPIFPRRQGQWSHSGAGAGVTESHQHLVSSTRRNTMFMFMVSSSSLKGRHGVIFAYLLIHFYISLFSSLACSCTLHPSLRYTMPSTYIVSLTNLLCLKTVVSSSRSAFL